MCEFYIEIKDKIDSKKLWSLIKNKNIHLTDLGDKVYIYGKTNFIEFSRILKKCSDVGRFVCSVSGGREDE